MRTVCSSLVRDGGFPAEELWTPGLKGSNGPIPDRPDQRADSSQRVSGVASIQTERAS